MNFFHWTRKSSHQMLIKTREWGRKLNFVDQGCLMRQKKHSCIFDFCCILKTVFLVHIHLYKRVQSKQFNLCTSFQILDMCLRDIEKWNNDSNVSLFSSLNKSIKRHHYYFQVKVLKENIHYISRTFISSRKTSWHNE